MEGDNRNETYKECLRNHAASLGSYATDGCGEFTMDEVSPGGLQCAACGCHRNFHRKVTYVAAHEGGSGGFGGRGGGGLLVCSSGGRSDGREHHAGSEIMAAGELVEYGGGGGALGRHEGGSRSPEMSERGGKMKRFRSKFTAEQKEKMLGFAEKLGWKMQRKDQEDEIERFCRSVGVSRQVFKVWMHNHKNSSSTSSTTSASTGNASSLTTQ